MSPSETVSTKRGSFSLTRWEDPAVFWVAARGFVTPELLRLDLERARDFGANHPGGWTYVADTSAVTAVHPANIFVLREIRFLPHLRRYLVIAPSPARRFLMRAGALVVSADAIVAGPGEAWKLCLGGTNPRSPTRD